MADRDTRPGAAAAAASGESSQENTDETAHETAADRRRRRDRFLRALNEARAVRNRVRPHRARAARMRQAIHMRTFGW